MESNGKPLHSRKLTIDVSVRLNVRNTAILADGVWKFTPVWTVSLVGDQFTFETPNPDGGVRLCDGHDAATQFLNLKTPQDALAFFQKYNWDENIDKKQPDPNKIRWSELQDIQKAFLLVLANEPVPQHLQEFIFQPVPVRLLHDVKVVDVISKKPVKKEKFDAVVGIADVRDVLSALRAEIFLSRGSVWRKCANPKCEMWFKPGRPDQKCHDSACTRRAIANRFSEKTRKAKKRRKR